MMRYFFLIVGFLILMPLATHAHGGATAPQVKSIVGKARDKVIDQIKETENEINSQIEQTGEDIIAAIEKQRKTLATNQERMIQSFEGLLEAKLFAETERQNTREMNEGAINHPVSQSACAIATASVELKDQMAAREDMNEVVSKLNDAYFNGEDQVSKNGSLAVNANIVRQRKFYAENSAMPDADVRADTVFEDGDWDMERQKAAILYLRTAMGLPADPVNLEDTSPGSAENVRRLATKMARVSMAQTTLTDLTNARASGFRHMLKEQSYRLFGGSEGNPLDFHKGLIELPPESVPREIAQQLAITNVLLFEMLTQMERQSALQSVEMAMLVDRE